MKTFIQYLAENTFENSDFSGPNRKIGDYLAIDKAFGKPIVGGNFIPSGTQTIKGSNFSSVMSVLKDSKPIKWSLLKNGIEKQIELFSNFKDSTEENTFVNVEDPIVKPSENGITLFWYKPYRIESEKSDWKVPTNTFNPEKKAI